MTTTSKLTARIEWDHIAVIDSDGGTWYPDAIAEAEIRAAADPAAAAVQMCDQQPMRGCWKD